MAEKPEKIELSAKQKTELLSLGLKTVAKNPQDKADLLYDILSNPLPVDDSAINMLPTPLRGLSRKVRSIAGAPIIELLTSSDTNILTIEAIKDYTKNLGKSTESEDLTEVWLSLYYTAIASGLVFHGRRITKHSNNHLAEAFGALTEKDWMVSDIVKILRQAQKHCQEELEGDNDSER